MQINNKGQSLVEIIIALSVAAITAVAIVRVVTASIKTSRSSQEQKIGLSIAQTEISKEIGVRNSTRNAYFSQEIPVLLAYFSSDNNYCIYKKISDISDELNPLSIFKLEIDVYWSWKNSSDTKTCDLFSANLANYDQKVSLETTLSK